jgi:hypothetical protein
MPGFWQTSLALATAYAQLGEPEAAGKALRELLAVRPDYATNTRQELLNRWHPEFAEILVDGLRKAGLEIAPKQS